MAFQYGEDIVAYFIAESTFGTAVKPTGTDAFLTSNFEISANYDRPEVPDRRGSRSVLERIDGRKSAGFNFTTTLRPSNTAGTAPDAGVILKHAFGTETVVASTSVTYSLLKDPSALSGSLYKKLADILEGVYGAVITNVTFNFGGDDFATIDVTGIGVDVLRAGKDAANGAGSPSTSLVVDDSDFYSKYGIIKIDTDDNSNTGYQISAVSGETLTIPSATWSDNDVVAPFVPAETVVGDALYGTVGSFSWDNGSTTVQIIGGNISMDTGIGLHEREFGTATPNSVVLPSARSVTFSLSMLVEDTQYFNIGEAYNRTQQDIQLVIGSTAGKIVTFNMDQAEVDPGPLGGAAGLVEVTLSGQALATSSGEDEFTVAFT